MMFIVRLTVLCFAAIVVCDQVDDSTTSANLYVEVGNPVNLSCIQPSATRTLSCNWERFGSEGHVNLELGTSLLTEEGEGRASYIGNGINDCSFNLKNVTQEDLAPWKGTLGWKKEDELPSYQVCKIKLIEKVAPSFVTIENKNDLESLVDVEGSQNNTITIKCCTDKAVAPPPELAFVFDGQLVQNTRYDEEESCLIWANATFSWRENRKELNCSLKHSMNDLMDSITVNVQYGPILLELKEEYFSVTANPDPEISTKTHFKIEKQQEATNVWTISPTLLTNEVQVLNISVSNVIKTVVIPFRIPAVTTTTTTTEWTTTVTTTTEYPKTTTETTEKPVVRQPAKKWTTTNIVLLVFGVVGCIVLLLVGIFIANRKGLFGTEHLIPKPDYPEEEPSVLYQANPMQL